METNESNVNIRINQEEKKNLKRYCLEHDISISDFLKFSYKAIMKLEELKKVEIKDKSIIIHND